MLAKKLTWIFAAAAVAIASQSPGQQAQDRGAITRELAREQEAAARERAALEREYAREQATAQRDLQRELAEAREQLARTVAEVARVSAQMSQPVLRDMERKLRFMVGVPAVLGLNIEDTDLGVLVSGVTPNGPAATAGVAVGDTIVAIDDVELARSANGADRSSPSSRLLAQAGTVVPGDEVKLRILRDGNYRDVVMTASANRLRLPVSMRGDNGWSTASWMPFRYFGAWSDIELVSLTPALGEYFGASEGLLVVRAGRAAELGFRDGDVIIDLAGREPQSPEHALRILASFEPGESLQAAIMRQRRREALAIRVPTAPSQ
jgi:S1-C subfamily serine protease